VNRREALAGLAAGSACAVLGSGGPAQARDGASLVLRNARVTTLDPSRPGASAIAIAGGRIAAVGDDAEVMPLADSRTRVIDIGGRRVIPGLIDSHTHVIRGGLNYNLELRWDGVPSLAIAMRMLREQAMRTPPPQWVRVVGGFNEYQFAEKRMPTLAELNAAAPDTPVFILRLYDRALLNRAALRAVGITKGTQDPPGSHIERDKRGEPTGLLIAKPNAALLYATLARGPKLSLADQMNSTRLFLRELNRLGVTSVIDAGGGFQNYPQDYEVVERLERANELTVRIAYNLFTQKPKEELADFTSWSQLVTPGQGSDRYRHNGAGEMLVYSAADFEDFREPRPDMPADMEADLERVVRHLAKVKWPFRMHATYDQTIGRALDVFERVNADVPLTGMRWFFDHAETISPRNIDRVKSLGGGIAVQHRMAYQGEDFATRYGREVASDAPPLRRILDAGVPLGAGTDATRVASYNPWVSLHWLVTGRTIGGCSLRAAANRLDRLTALRLWTHANTWFSGEEGRKGMIRAGQLADLAVLSADYLTVDDEEIKGLASVITLLDGNIVHAAGEFRALAPPLPAASPDWSPVNRFAAHDPAPVLAPARHSACFERSGAWSSTGCDCWMG
jgi:predicted amidohydrolase YtcJ